ncbi:hypothetical protein [Vibrio fluvialis]|uniref:hypothetical protein n=1 Tax=Vibrio fluvialis TaxID=676 RepID=UPI002ACEC63D|nr:hypothetical protein [Vibrio fluvialis]
MLKKISMFLESILFTSFFFFKNFFSNTKLGNGPIPVVVSLTTYSARIGTVYLTIESILAQKESPQRIVLWLSSEENIVIPSSLKRLQRRGLEIKFVKGNLRSYKKLSHAGDLFSNTLLVSADDDIIYPSHWLGSLYREHLKFPKSVICFRGHEISVKDGKVQPYSSFMSRSDYPKTPSKHLIPTGCSGVLYPIGSLTIEASDRYADDFMSIAPDADDFWYKCVTLKNGYNAKRVLAANVHFPPILISLGEGLFHKNVRNNENDSKLAKCLSHFNLHHLLKKN